MRKRICSFLLAFVLCFLLWPGSTVAAANTYTINGVSVSHTSSSISKNCWTYANEIYKKIWGYNFSPDRASGDNMLRNISSKSELSLTADNLKKYVSSAALGSVIRTTNDSCLFTTKDSVGHSQIIVKKSANGFTVLESNIGKGYSREYAYTWKSYIEKWYNSNHKYIKYIKWSGAAPYSSEPYLTVNVTHAPSGNLQSGKGFSLEGTINSSHPISRVTAYIGQKEGKQYSNHSYDRSYSTNENVYSYNIKRDGIDSAIKFGDLPAGTYVFQVIAYNSAGKKVSSPVYRFTIKSSSTAAATTNTIKNGVYTLTPKCATSARLDIAGGSTNNCANVQIYQANNTAAQRFRFNSLGNGYYRITAVVSGKVLDVQNGSTKSGANVWQYPSNNSNAQQWKLTSAGNGYYYISPRLNTGLCLDVSGAGSANGTNVQVYAKNNTPAQMWKLTAA